MFERVRQLDSVNNTKSAAAPLLRGALLVGAALLLGGCVTGGGYESPYYAASAGVEINQPPPPLPAYAQPPCPGDGYLWVPGYWAYSGGYYWVPGTWVLPPEAGLLWTPGYWGFAGGAYVWHAGYWGPHVGFYGGVHYGFGYNGVGYMGGRWEGPHFVYNRYVTNVDARAVRYTYSERVDRRDAADRVSYDGGRDGIIAYPTREDRRYAHEAHLGATFSQRAHIQQAARNRALFARENSGRPPIAATPRPGRFQGPGVERARGAERFDPRAARWNDRPQARFASRPNAPNRPDFAARPNVHARPRYQTHPAFYGQRPRARPQPSRRVRARRGSAGRPQGRPAHRRNRRPPDHRDH